jgi:hypothetical protein
MMSQSCYETNARKCATIPKGHDHQRLPHGHKQWGPAQDHELRRLIPTVARNVWGMRCHIHLALWCQFCEMLMRPEAPRMWMWLSSYLANRQVASVSPMSVPSMPLSQRLPRMAPQAWSEPVLTSQRMRWLLFSYYGLVLFMFSSFVLID